MAKRGRKKLTPEEKIKIVPAYLTGKQKKAIEKKYKTLTDAVKERVLTEC